MQLEIQKFTFGLSISICEFKVTLALWIVDAVGSWQIMPMPMPNLERAY